jgi:O-antigen ligase
MVRAAPFLPAAALLAIWIHWVRQDGGYFPRDWYPPALFAVALLAVVVLAARRWRTGSTAADAALAVLSAFTAWCFASLIWARSPGSAWEAADQMLLFLAMAWVIALVPWRSGSATLFLGAWSVAVAGACAIELVSALGAADVGRYFVESRWQQPTGYANTAAAIGAMGAWPALVLSARRAMPIAAQLLLLAAGVFLIEFSLLAQSRAALVVTLLVVPLAVAMTGDRTRLLVRLAVAAAAIAVAAGPIADVYAEGEAGRSLAEALDHAVLWMGVSIAVAVVAGLAAAAAERRVGPRPRAVRAARVGALAVAVAVALAGTGVAIARHGDLVDYADERWADFKSDEEVPREEGTRAFLPHGDKRYDYWRVSLNALRDAPAGGIGAGGFEREYTIHRRYEKPSRAAHSIWMRSLAETGLVGTGLLVLFVVVAGVGLLRARRRLDPAGRTVVAACAAASGYFVVHASFDWLELVPAIAAPAAALPFVAMRLGGRPDAPPGPESPVRRRAAAAAGAVLAVAALAALTLPYFSIRSVNSAIDRPASDSAGVDRDLDRAAALNPLSPEPHLVGGRLALVRRDYDGAREAFERALEEEQGWYAHFELALLDAHAGRFATAERRIARARALNRPDHLMRDTAELIRRRVRIDPATVDRRKLDIRLYDDPRSTH